MLTLSIVFLPSISRSVNYSVQVFGGGDSQFTHRKINLNKALTSSGVHMLILKRKSKFPVYV